MQQLIAIALGGSAGALLRFSVANGIYAILGRGFPHGTLVVNIVGSFLMGMLTELLVFRFAVAAEYRAAILVGFLGAFTTFSTFALETLTLFEQGSLLKAFLNVFLSVVLCLTACWVGLIWGRTLFTDALPGLHRHIPNIGIFFGFAGLLIASTITEILFNHYHSMQGLRAPAFIILLGLLSLSSTLWFGLKETDTQPEFQHLLSLFIINTLCGAAMIWSGSWIGNWLWQLKQSL
jgi:CrcB protein